MTLADDLKADLPGWRAIPGQLGLRPHTVTLLSRSWDGTHSGDGNRSDVGLSLVEGDGQSPKVRWLSDEELAVGDLARGTVNVGRITADHAAREWLEEIRGDNLMRGDGRFLIITGPTHPTGAKYRITKITSERALHYMIQGKPVDSE